MRHNKPKQIIKVDIHTTKMCVCAICEVSYTSISGIVVDINMPKGGQIWLQYKGNLGYYPNH